MNTTLAHGLRCLLLLAGFASRALADHLPPPPVIIDPSYDFVTVSPYDMHMECLPLASQDPAAVQTASEWEVWTFTPLERIWHTGTISDLSMNHVHLGDGMFENSYAGQHALHYWSQYSVKVRYQDSRGLWSGWAVRGLSTGAPAQVFPLVMRDVAQEPVPVWTDEGGAPVILPSGFPQPRLRLETNYGYPYFYYLGFNDIINQFLNYFSLADHLPARAVLECNGAAVHLPASRLSFYDGAGSYHEIHLPRVDAVPGKVLAWWISSDGGSYLADPALHDPDFSTPAAAAPVPWAARQPGYVVEKVAGRLRLPLAIAFAPTAPPAPTDPLAYVAELYGSIRVLLKNGTLSTYADHLLNYDPNGIFPGSGEQGIGGICVDSASGDLFCTLLYDSNPPGGEHYARVIRLHSLDGGHTAASISTVFDMSGELMGASHYISHCSIGPDHMLYVHVGDGFDPPKARDLQYFRGKILRMNLDGTPPPDNPFHEPEDSVAVGAKPWIFASGFRNSFGGAWRELDGAHYAAENGPATNDRLARIDAGADYGWDGSDSSMINRAIYNWNPVHAPVDLAFVQPGTFGGSGYPPAKMDRCYVAESGATYALGIQERGKRIVEFQIAPDGQLVAGPVPFVEYTGMGRASAVGLAAGPDGLYFTDLYRDLDAITPIDSGAGLYRIRYVGSTARSVDFAATPTVGFAPLAVQFQDLSRVEGATGWSWDFGDGQGSFEQNPVHTYLGNGSCRVILRVTGPQGDLVRQSDGYVLVGGRARGFDASYFNPADTVPVLRRTDAAIQFAWGDSAPGAGVLPDSFRVVWAGRLAAPDSGVFKFHVVTRDSVRLWLDDSLVADRIPAPESAQVVIPWRLERNRLHSLRLAYFAGADSPSVRLEWEGPGTPLAGIPTARVCGGDSSLVAGIRDDPRGPRPELVLVGRGFASKHAILRYRLPAGGPAQLALYDVGGRRVRSLVARLVPGHAEGEVQLDTGQLSSGVYFARLASAGTVIVRRLVVLH